MSLVVAQVAVLPVVVVSHLHRARVVNSMRLPARVVESWPPCHLCLVKDAQCIVVIASSCSVPLAIAAMTRTAIVIAEAAIVMAIPVSGVVTGVIAAIPAGKILQGHPFRVPPEGNSHVTLSYLFESTHPLPFHHDHRLQPCYQSCQACIMHHVDDLLRIFVGRGSFFSEQPFAMHAHGDALSNQLIV